MIELRRLVFRDFFKSIFKPLFTSILMFGVVWLCVFILDFSYETLLLFASSLVLFLASFIRLCIVLLGWFTLIMCFIFCKFSDWLDNFRDDVKHEYSILRGPNPFPNMWIVGAIFWEPAQSIFIFLCMFGLMWFFVSPSNPFQENLLLFALLLSLLISSIFLVLFTITRTVMLFCTLSVWFSWVYLCYWLEENWDDINDRYFPGE